MIIPTQTNKDRVQHGNYQVSGTDPSLEILFTNPVTELRLGLDQTISEELSAYSKSLVPGGRGGSSFLKASSAGAHTNHPSTREVEAEGPEAQG